MRNQENTKDEGPETRKSPKKAFISAINEFANGFKLVWGRFRVIVANLSKAGEIILVIVLTLLAQFLLPHIASGVLSLESKLPSVPFSGNFYQYAPKISPEAQNFFLFMLMVYITLQWPAELGRETEIRKLKQRVSELEEELKEQSQLDSAEKSVDHSDSSIESGSKTSEINR